MENEQEKEIVEIDKKYGQQYKKAMNQFMVSLENEIKESPRHYKKRHHLRSITFEDVEYFSGYYFYQFEANSVVQFHIKECPGWLFGIWWDLPKDQNVFEEKTNLGGTLFTQYEKNVDKFKPSRSEISCDFRISLNEEPYENLSIVADTIGFIHREPYLSFYRDWMGCDFDYFYHSRFEALCTFIKWKISDHLFDLKKKFTFKQQTHFMKKILKKNRKKFVLGIFNNGPDWYNEFSIYGYFTDQTISSPKPGEWVYVMTDKQLKH